MHQEAMGTHVSTHVCTTQTNTHFKKPEKIKSELYFEKNEGVNLWGWSQH